MNSPPVYKKPQILNPETYGAVQNEFQFMWHQDNCKPPKCHWSCLHVVQKNLRNILLVGDYKRLNVVSLRD